MPNQPTSFSRRFQEYSNILSTMAKNDTLREMYGQFHENLKQLSDYINDLNGSKAREPLTGERLERLKQLYAQTVRATDDYIAQAKKTRGGEASAYVAGEISRLLHKDAKVIDRIPQNSNIRMSDAFRRARTHYVDIGAQKTQRVGCALSLRTPVEFVDENNNVRRGFFTPNYRIGDEKALLDTFQGRFPQYQDVWDLVRGDPDLLSRVLEATRQHKQGDVAFNGQGNDPLGEVMPLERYDQLCRDQEFKNIFKEFRRARSSQRGRDQTFMEPRLLNADGGTSVTDRNCAMSTVANLLGLENVLANSERMTLVQNGHQIEGCFMETAPGHDAANFNFEDGNDLMFRWIRDTAKRPEPRVSANALRQMADLQTLDYLCGNIDRHRRNFMYRFTQNENGDPVLDGVMGIDNDESFGKDILYAIGKVHNIGIFGLTVMPRSTADRVMELSEEKLDYALADYGLSMEEKNMAKKRLKLLQERILEARVIGKDDNVPQNLDPDGDGRMTIVDDDKFNQLQLGQLQARGMVYLSLSTVEMGNLFDKMVKVPESLKKEIDRGELEYKPDAVTYTRGTLAEPAAMDRDCVVSRFADAARFSVDLYYDAWWNTKEFKEMRTALDELSNLPKGTSLEETMAKCHELLEKTQHYIDLKKDAPETQRGRERLSFARRLRDICSDVIDDHRAAQLNEGDLPQVQPGGVIGQGDNLFQPQTVSQQMEERRELASMDMLHALRLNGRNGAVEPFARLLYYTKALDFVRENGEAASAGLLKEKTVNANMDRVMDLARTTLENMDEGELMYMIGEMAPARKLSAMAARTLGVEEPGRAMSQPQPGSERQMSGPGVPSV